MNISNKHTRNLVIITIAVIAFLGIIYYNNYTAGNKENTLLTQFGYAINNLLTNIGVLENKTNELKTSEYIESSGANVR